MADDRRIGGEYRRHTTSLPGQSPVPDRVDATVHPMQSPDLRRLRDRVSSVSQLDQLPGPDHAVLPSRQLGQRFMPNP